MSSTWHVDNGPAISRGNEPAPAGGMVSLAFVRDTLRRLWFVWVGTTVLGAALATGWLLLIPPQSVGTVTLLLAHDPSTDPEAAMATDVSLLETRAVAQRLGTALGSDESPDALLKTIVAEPTTSSVLQLNVTGSGPNDAVRRARLLADTYLGYRQQQLTQQAEAVTKAYRQRIDALQIQVDDLTTQYDAIMARGAGGEQASDVLASRGQLIGQIADLENRIENQTLEANAVVAASRVLDQASLVPQPAARRAVLSLGSGLVGGLGLGLGLLLVYAITTGRLRSRADVAAATGLPVLFSAGPVLPRRHRRGSRPESALALLTDGLETALPTRGKSRRLGLIALDCEEEGARVLAALARRLGARDSVLAVDAAGTGLLARELESSEDEPSSTVAVVSGTGLDAVADVVLTLVPFEFGRGLAHVAFASARWVVLVKAGRSTTEQLSTLARSARTSGLRIEFVMLVDADESDASFGAEGGVEREEAGR